MIAGRAGMLEGVLAAAAALSLGWAAGPLVWQATGAAPVPVPQAVAAAAPAAAPPRTVDTARLLALAPFGRVPEEAPPPATDIPATALVLTLLGVTLADNPARSRAIIAVEGQPAAAYAVGAAVTDGVRLAAVEADRVLLEVGERTEALAFPVPDGAGTVGRAAAALPFTPGPGIVPVVADRPPSADPDVAVAWYRAEIDRSPETVMERLGIAAGPAGYRILDSAPPDVRQAGFLPGDVVAKVNGAAVGDVAADRLRLDEIIAAGRASVDILRGGETIRLSFPLR